MAKNIQLDTTYPCLGGVLLGVPDHILGLVKGTWPEYPCIRGVLPSGKVLSAICVPCFTLSGQFLGRAENT
jgi:hypothetical protein